MTPHHRTTDLLKETVTHVPGALSWSHFSLGPAHTPVDAIQQTATAVNTALPHHLGELPSTAQFGAAAPAVLTKLAGVPAGRVKGNQDLEIEHRGDGALNTLPVNGALPADCGNPPNRLLRIPVKRRLLRKV